MEKRTASTPTLPTSTADLHWSDFRGPIQNILAQNSVKHPELLDEYE